jgi:outer membrane protein
MTSSLRVRILLALAAIALWVSASPADAQQAQPKPAAKPAAPAAQQAAPPVLPLPPKGTLIVIVDPPTIEQHASAFQAVRVQHDKMIAGQQTEITKLEKDLRASDEELNKQRTILSPEAYAQKRRDLDKRFQDAQQTVQGKRRDIDQVAGDAYNKVVRQMLDLIAELMAENDYKIVMARPQLVASQNSLDVSGEIISRLNKKMPTVAVATPK